MLTDFIIKNAAPIIENRIKDIIQGIASELNLDAIKLDTMLKTVNGNIEIFVFYENKQVKRLPLSEVRGNITGMVESHMESIFQRDALVYNTHPAYVNYVFRLYPDGSLAVWPNIAGVYQQKMKLKDIL
jgi:hypothetical protein